VPSAYERAITCIEMAVLAKSPRVCQSAFRFLAFVFKCSVGDHTRVHQCQNCTRTNIRHVTNVKSVGFEPANTAPPKSWTTQIEEQSMLRSAARIRLSRPSNCRQTSAWSDKLQRTAACYSVFGRRRKINAVIC
jgi:hypothetical protein